MCFLHEYVNGSMNLIAHTLSFSLFHRTKTKTNNSITLNTATPLFQFFFQLGRFHFLHFNALNEHMMSHRRREHAVLLRRSDESKRNKMLKRGI